MTKDEWWLMAAISDDGLVAELLLRLKDSAAESSPPPPSTVMKAIPLSWGLRQPRSSVEKKRDNTPRRSPTTPLSFGVSGGGGSPSDGYEDSSGNVNHHHEAHPQPSDRFRSKISASTETPTTTSKRPRRKKTFAELKEEESWLLKERTHLKKELATLRLTLKEQRSINDNLKKMKLDLHVESGLKSEANSIEPLEERKNTNQNGASEAASSNTSRQVKSEDASAPDSCLAQTHVPSSSEPGFVLPDLNMMPDEECMQEGIVGMS